MHSNLIISLLTLVFSATTIISATAATPAQAQQQPQQSLYFPYRPALTPDGSEIYFSYDGDIFKVAAKGGEAIRVIAMEGTESNPEISPDGKYLAFSSDIQGNNDVYVVPTKGGEIVRLTYHDGADYPVSWSPDSKYIYFETSRDNASRTTYKVAVTGGTPIRLFNNYFNTIVNVVESPKSGELFFNESTESINFPTRKRYVGDHNPNIKSWNPANKSYKEYTTYEGKDTWPMVDKNGNLYYVSDELNKESNIVKYISGDKPQWLTKFDKSIQYPAISYNGNAIVFIKEYQLHLLYLNTNKVTTPQITFTENNVEVRRHIANAGFETFSPSPDGKKFAFSIRGLLYISDAKATYFKRLETPENERIKEIIWSNDNNTLYYTRTNKGWADLYKIKADGSSAEQLVASAPTEFHALTGSHDHKKAAFISGSKDLKMITFANDMIEDVAQAEFWAFYSPTMSFSYDDNFLTFEAKNLFENDIFVYDLKEKKLINITNSASTESTPYFAPDGKALYFIANPTSTTFPRGSAGATLYKLPLQWYDKPYKSAAYDKLFADEKSAAKADSTKNTIKIDTKDVFRRIEKVIPGGRQHAPFTYKLKDKAWLFFNSNHEGRIGLYSLEISNPDAKVKVIKDLGLGDFAATDKDLYFTSRGAIYKIDPNSLMTTKIDIKPAIEKNLRNEFEQMFYEVWAALAQNFYDVRYHGVNWEAIRDYYAQMIPYVRTRANLRTLVTDMLGELNSSHLGFSTGGVDERTTTSAATMETGLIFSNKEPYKVEGIIPFSPAYSVDIDVRKGDKLVAVDGVRTSEAQNRVTYFTKTKAQDEILLTFDRGGKEFSVKMHTIPTRTLKNLLYTQWEEDCRAAVEKKSKGRIAYHHMRAMGDEDLTAFLTAMHTDAVHKDALILDLRYNNGGNVHKEVIDFLRGEQHFTWSHRDFEKNSHPNVAPAGKPIICLVNEHSLSDAEVTSNGIKSLGIAKIVGTETYRWIIFTTSARLVDGSSTRIPAWGCYNNSGEDMESVGVKPDIYIKTTFKDRMEGTDPQLYRAIEEILKGL